jgi:hypothetical protein
MPPDGTDRWVALSDLFEKLSARQLEHYEIGGELVYGAVGLGDLLKICELSIRLIEDTRENQRMPVGRGTVVPPKEIKVLTVAMLDACNFYGRPPPNVLIRLNEMLLGAEIRSRSESKRAEEKRQALHIFAANPKAGHNEVARALGVSKGAISNWFKEPDFKKRLNEMRFLSSELNSNKPKPK